MRLALLMRWAIVASGTRYACAISRGGEAADGPQRQRDGRRRGKARVRAQEIELQGVVRGGRSGRRLVATPLAFAAVPRGVGSGEVDEATPRRA